MDIMIEISFLNSSAAVDIFQRYPEYRAARLSRKHQFWINKRISKRMVREMQAIDFEIYLNSQNHKPVD